MPSWFNSSRDTSTAGLDAVPGLTPEACWTTNPIGFGLTELFGIMSGTPAGAARGWRGGGDGWLPAVFGLTVLVTELNGE